VIQLNDFSLLMKIQPKR